MSKMIRLIAVIVVLSFIFIGCTQSGDTENTSNVQTTTAESEKSETTAQQTEQPQEPLEISWVNRVDTAFVAEDNPVWEAIEEAANVVIDLEIPPINNYTDRLNVIMSSGDLPDIVHIQSFDASYYSWAEDGLLIPLDDYIGSCENVMAKTTEEQFELARVPSTQMIHLFPRPHAENIFGGLIRADWLSSLGLEEPTTPEEFLTVARAFTFDDPDGNGVDDTYGCSMTGLNLSMVFNSAFNLLTFYPDKNGVVTIVEAQDGYMEMLDYFKMLYDEGVMDPEWYTNQGYAEHDKFKAGEIGIDTNGLKPVTVYSGDIPTSIKGAFPEAELGFFNPIKNESGESFYCTNVSIWGGFGVTSSSENPERVIEFIDWCFSDEGIALTNFGVKGITYESFEYSGDGVLAKLTYASEEQYNDFTQYVSKYMSFITAINGKRIIAAGATPEDQDAYIKAVDDYKEQVTLNYYPGFNVLSEYTKLTKEQPELADYLQEHYSKYIVGEISRDEMVSFLENTYITAYEPVIQEMQEYWDNMS